MAITRSLRYEVAAFLVGSSLWLWLFLSSLRALPIGTPPVVMKTKLWIHVVGWCEGMSAWRHSFSEVYLLAQTLNAVMVEPCVTRGRLLSCGKVSNGTTTFTQVLDHSPSLHTTPHLATYKEFMEATHNNNNNNNDTDKINLITIQACWGTYNSDCRQKLRIDDTRNKASQPPLDQAVSIIRSQSISPTTTNIILQPEWIIHGAINNWRPSDRNIAKKWKKSNKKDTREKFAKDLQFPPREFDHVRNMLHRSFNITPGEPFAAIQWRPEGPLCDGSGVASLEGNGGYAECARAILQVRDVISERDNIPKENFLLVSPLSTKHELQWGGVANLADRNANTSYPSLQVLLDGGFHKLEQAHNLTDGTFLAVWDFIVAMTATTFTTCGKGSCDKKQVCSRCNHCGFSSLYVLSLRDEYQKGKKGTQTDQCWPIGD